MAESGETDAEDGTATPPPSSGLDLLVGDRTFPIYEKYSADEIDGQGVVTVDGTRIEFNLRDCTIPGAPRLIFSFEGWGSTAGGIPFALAVEHADEPDNPPFVQLYTSEHVWSADQIAPASVNGLSIELPSLIFFNTTEFEALLIEFGEQNGGREPTEDELIELSQSIPSFQASITATCEDPLP